MVRLKTEMQRMWNRKHSTNTNRRGDGVSEIQELEVEMLKARVKYLERLVSDQGIVVEGNVGEMIARKIETDDFYTSRELNDLQVHAVLACRMRYANMARGKY